MFKKIKIFFVLLFLFLLFFTAPNGFILADQNLLQKPVRDVFNWAVGIAAVLAGIFFAIGAVQYISALDNPSAKKDAVERMISSLLGLTLLLGSVIIMDTINPSIKNLEVRGLAAGPGIVYSNGNLKDDKPAPMEESDSTSIQNMGYQKIKYTCIGNTGAPIIIWFYPNKYFVSNEIDYSDVNYRIVPCGTSTDLQGESFRIAFELPGVYFFTKKDCGGFMSDPFTTDVNNIPSPFKNNLRSMWILNELTGDGLKYGAILHNSNFTNMLGPCTRPIIDDNKDNYNPMENCINIDINANSATVFTFTPIKRSNEGVGWIGPRVEFYSKAWGWSTGFGAIKGLWSGAYTQVDGYNDANNNLFPHLSYDSEKLTFDYGHVNEPKEYAATCPNFSKCPGSIRILGNYLVGLYTEKSDNGHPFCQLFRSNINSLKETEFLATGKSIKNIEIIAIGKEKGKEVSPGAPPNPPPVPY